MRKGLIGADLTNNFTKLVSEKFAFNDYEMVEMKQEQLFSLLQSKDFECINITSPYKKDVLPYIDVLSENAQAILAVDTIVNRDGILYGYNTDYSAFMYMINKHSISLANKKILILGNGGTCAALKVAAQRLGAKEIVVVDIEESEGAISYIDCFAQHLDSEILINTSPIGMSPDIDNAPIDINLFYQCETVIDLIYNPILTKLGFDAQECGIKRIIGMEMLVAQTKYAVEIFTGKAIDDACVNRVLHEMLVEQSNIVLIGMPSAGKTTIGKRLEKRLGKTFIDLDDVVVEKAKIPIPEIFAKSKEAGFRKLESMVALELSCLNNCVISTGGGTIKNKSNMDYLRLNGITIFIDRDLDKLVSADPNRPLSSSKEALRILHEERRPLYQKYASATVLNNSQIEESVEEIINAYYQITQQVVNETYNI
ncbi:MAG: shikimate dehydrogenase [Erysipelotrichia bacterium]|nr:shikimate dehydrogenase [Erysipelotrichia bacterium]NCC55030.1 shikimate dehydrogenase [Erysipelotrichia bacterium]